MRRLHGARRRRAGLLLPDSRCARSTAREVTTIEGLGGDHPLQRAFMDEVGAQCGICTPGMIMAALTLGPRPRSTTCRIALAGNLCRCTGYSGDLPRDQCAHEDSRDAASLDLVPDRRSRR